MEKETNKKYAVFCLLTKLDAMGVDAKLPKGQYIIPVFDDYEEAKEYAKDRFEIIIVEIPT